MRRRPSLSLLTWCFSFSLCGGVHIHPHVGTVMQRRLCCQQLCARQVCFKQQQKTRGTWREKKDKEKKQRSNGGVTTFKSISRTLLIYKRQRINSSLWSSHSFLCLVFPLCCCSVGPMHLKMPKYDADTPAVLIWRQMDRLQAPAQYQEVL